MHNTTDKYLLQIEPKNVKKAPVVDGLVWKMQYLIDIADAGTLYRGFHTCKCGVTSANYDYLVAGYITNSLATHYLMYHREDVPESEIKKLENITLENINVKVL